MNAWITLLLNVGIGSAIGGITNDLAICFAPIVR